MTTTTDGQKHTVSVKERDYLQQDSPIRGQNYVCLSFVSPEDVIQRKEISFFMDFISSFSTGVSDMFDSLTARFGTDAQVVDMLKSVRGVHDHIFDAKSMSAQFEHYVTQNRAKLEKDYYENNGFQTSVRGIKVRGAYETLHDAQQRALAIQKFDNKHNVFVAEVGCWCPWSPHAGELEKQEYMETQLNTIVKGYDESRSEASQVFNQDLRNVIESNQPGEIA